MDNSENNKTISTKHKNFWDSLHMDIMTSNQKLTKEDCKVLMERSLLFSLIFRGCSPLEIAAFQKLLGVKENVYIILVDLSKQNQSSQISSEIDEFELIHFIKKNLIDFHCILGPIVTKRISILISVDDKYSDEVHLHQSVAIAEQLVGALDKKFSTQAAAGIGSVQNISSIYTSFIEALSCMNLISTTETVCSYDVKHKEILAQFDYSETEKRLFEAVRQKKAEAYDYFCVIMNFIRPLNDDMKRNRILELLLLSNRAFCFDNPRESKAINYSSYLNQFMSLSGDKLIEFAFQSFIAITNFVKPQTSIDYTNNIVKATREYLEKHYAEDISLEDMAAQVNISPQYFSKLIKKTTGFNFIDWLSTLRVKKAKELLTNSNLTVKEVCFMVGYKDPNYFSRIFKKRIGITPSEYIKTNSMFSNTN